MLPGCGAAELRSSQPAGVSVDRAGMGRRDCGPLPTVREGTDTEVWKGTSGGGRSEISTGHGAGPGLRQSGMHIVDVWT